MPPSASASIEEEGSAELYNLRNQDSLTGMDMAEKSAKGCLSAATEDVGSVTSSEKLNLQPLEDEVNAPPTALRLRISLLISHYSALTVLFSWL